MASENRQSQYIIGTSATPYTLTASYVAGTILKSSSAYQLNLLVSYTPGAGNTTGSIQIIVETASPIDNSTDQASLVASDFYQTATQSVSAGTSTMTQQLFTFQNTGTTALRFPISLPIADKFTRVSAKETTGGGVAGTATVIAVTSEQVNY